MKQNKTVPKSLKNETKQDRPQKSQIKGGKNMLDFKKEIANSIAKVVELNSEELYTFIEVPKDSVNGDYAFPCFKLAKELRKSPMVIAEEIKEKIELNNEVIEKVVVVSGYLNFFVNKNKLAEEIVKEFDEVAAGK